MKHKFPENSESKCRNVIVIARLIEMRYELRLHVQTDKFHLNTLLMLLLLLLIYWLCQGFILETKKEFTKESVSVANGYAIIMIRNGQNEAVSQLKCHSQLFDMMILQKYIFCTVISVRVFWLYVILYSVKIRFGLAINRCIIPHKCR